MSGICGLFNLDQAPVAQADLRAMTAMLERRGPERTGQSRDGPVGLGHTLLATTPELVFERQPFEHAETGCVITADVRLDNRDELIGALAPGRQHEPIGDAELILLAYLTWGEHCPEHLLGDFAFAIRDPRQQLIFCARDHFGMRPLYYHHVLRQRFVFASDARAILVLPQVPYRINDGRVADFLVPELEWIDYTSTFFEHVFRLPPGHRATVTPTGINIAEYWRPEPGPQPGPLSDDDYAQGFLEIFTRAIEARLRAPTGTVASMLSGGMDSGSVVAVAKDILSARGDAPLPTFSAARHRNADCAESTAIYAAIRMQSISPALVHPEAIGDNFEQLIAGNEEPFDGEFMILKAIYGAAHKRGAQAVLDGGAGDVVFSEGSYIVRLIRHGHIRQALAEIAAESTFWGGGSPGRSFFRYTRAALVPEAAKRLARDFRSHHNVRGFLHASLISAEFAASVGIEERFERMRQTFPSGWTADYAVERCNAIRPNVTGGRERYARIAAATGIEARDPFLDKRVVDFCARLPGRLRLQGGWPKMLLRKVMAEKLPEEVLSAKGKPHLGWLFNAAVTEQAVQRGELSIGRLGEALTDYVDSAALAKAWQAYREGGDAEQIHSAYLLSEWLREAARRPVVPGR